MIIKTCQRYNFWSSKFTVALSDLRFFLAYSMLVVSEQVWIKININVYHHSQSQINFPYKPRDMIKGYCWINHDIKVASTYILVQFNSNLYKHVLVIHTYPAWTFARCGTAKSRIGGIWGIIIYLFTFMPTGTIRNKILSKTNQNKHYQHTWNCKDWWVSWLGLIEFKLWLSLICWTFFHRLLSKGYKSSTDKQFYTIFWYVLLCIDNLALLKRTNSLKH